MRQQIAELLRPEADILFVVPPFAWLHRPALGVHLLQALARKAGREAQVLYANFLFARHFDEGTHNTVAQMQYGLFLGERLFARAAFGGPALGHDSGEGMRTTINALVAAYRRMGVSHSLSFEAILRLEQNVDGWLDSFVPVIAARRYSLVGATSSFEQNLSSIAILQQIKRLNPGTTVILGGANCEGEMAEGVSALAPLVDHIFAGESERAFVEFLEGKHTSRIIAGEPCEDLDAIPTPDFTDYFLQLHAVLPHTAMARDSAVHLAYESSRGCWWGQKSHCTFCGLNGHGMKSRNKSADRVIADLRLLTERHGIKRVGMTDNIMPHEYFTTFLPRVQTEVPGVQLMYEEKANLKLAQVRALVAGGVVEIQPGIEAISTGLLKLMAKGTTAAQNIALLRYAKATDLLVQWNLLYGLPNDEPSFYEETIELMPLLHHLQPPVGGCPAVIDRFSPYFERPELYGITDVRPFSFYTGVFGAEIPLRKLAYHFEGTYPTVAKQHPALVSAIAAGVATWRRRFYGPDPARLTIERVGTEYLLSDTRDPNQPVIERISHLHASAALTTRAVRHVPLEVTHWLLERKLAAVRDAKLVVFAVAEPELLAELEGAPTPSLDVLRVVS